MLTLNKIKLFLQHNIYLPSYEDIKISHLIVTFTENTVNFIKKINVSLRVQPSIMHTRNIVHYRGFCPLKINRRLLILNKILIK